MFQTHRIDITSNIKQGRNVLGIIFESALRHGRNEVTSRGDLACWNGDASRLYVRKAQYQWGWDWGESDISLINSRSEDNVLWSLETDFSGSIFSEN